MSLAALLPTILPDSLSREDELPAPEVIDRLIAEWVLGWTRDVLSDTLTVWRGPEEVLEDGRTRWSTDVARAFELVEFLTPWGTLLTFECWKSVLKPLPYRARFNGRTLYSAAAATPAMAICLAVLRLAAAEPARLAALRAGTLYEDESDVLEAL